MMLHQFTFKNFKSFRKETTLDLLATSIKEHQSDVVTDHMDEKVLKIAAIYGANASGKSNVISAFQSMRLLVLNSFRDDEKSMSYLPETNWFEEEDVPTEFSVLFSTNECIYQYGFSISHGNILEEYLYQRDSSQKKENYIELFTREGNLFSGKLLDDIGENNILDFVDDQTLFLSVMSRLKIGVLREVNQWFREINIADYGNPNRESHHFRMLKGFYRMQTSPLLQLIEDPNEKKQLERFIRAIDVGISGIGIIEDSISVDLYEKETREIKRVVTYHKHPKTGELLATPLQSESSGTLKMLFLYVDLKRVMDIGGTIFVDELDAKLHPLLIRYILIMFHNKKINPKNAQLIFSTQEIFTLDKENLRRDEIWFVDKNEVGESDLYPLVSYVDSEDKKIRNDASYGKDYILGRYKSIPRLKRMDELDG